MDTLLAHLQRADLGDFLPLLIFGIWIASAVFGDKKKKKRLPEEESRAPSPPAPAKKETRAAKPPGSTLADILKDIERELRKPKAPPGRPGAPKAPVPPPPPTRSQSPFEKGQRAQPRPQPRHQPRPQSKEGPPAEGMIGETFSGQWHERSAADTQFEESWHRMSETLPAQRTRPSGPVQLKTVSGIQKPVSPFVQKMLADLSGGPESLSRAMVLREVLGPPLALRNARGRRF